MTIEEIKTYQQVRTPDMASLAAYVAKAKGPNHTMAQFAEDTQIGASTLSRIVNCNIKKPLSIDMIISIFEKRADISDELLLSQIARANGLYPADYADRMKEREAFEMRHRESMNREILMKNAIVAGVAACGIPIKQVNDSPLSNNDGIQVGLPRIRADFTLDLNSESNLGSIKTWMFFLYPQISVTSDMQSHRPVRFDARRIMDRISAWFLADAWYPECMKGRKISFAFLDEALFDAFREMVSVVRLHTEMTILLLDQTTFAVTKEVWIPGEYEQLSNISVFEAPAPVADDEEYDDYGKFYDYEKTEDTE
ncbi:hypothetical protein [Robinsoniella peoriensis]|uniref:hypothetical protein n=1 Tax=Robinsoniella peoriensis TaxID=180332 RepID=UPI003645426C